MENVLGVINLVHENENLKELTLNRCQASIPFGGRYRLIDFTLSNMVNSGMKEIGVFAYNKYRSLLDHLGTGKEWDLDRKKGGLFILPPNLDAFNNEWAGDLNNYSSHIEFFERGTQQDVLITSGNIIANMNYREIYNAHKKVNADITIIYDNSVLESDIMGLKKNVSKIQDVSPTFFDILLIKKDVLINLIKEFTQENTNYDLGKAIRQKVNDLKLYMYHYNGELRRVDDINSYYKYSLQLLQPKTWRTLMLEPSPVITKSKDEPPSKYLETSNVRNTLIANGCTVEGTVENSIIGRGVRIEKGSIIRNSIIMQKCEIHANAIIEHAIIDKNATVLQGSMVRGKEEEPIVIQKKAVV